MAAWGDRAVETYGSGVRYGCCSLVQLQEIDLILYREKEASGINLRGLHSLEST